MSKVRAVFFDVGGTLAYPHPSFHGVIARVLAEHGGKPVVAEQGNLLIASFHPELVGETRLHEYLLRKV